ncbi:bifunctional tRNA (5-methylaminomethyl-2-thiouridine)(34)-methyltransferase MnmD/FAD-dependent 5-carboxymethylaminomethyl-2-thiouridine(34) oxidoreductase MnmC [Bowmanella sp. JS7-9]|uniref:tRNA 5-methylaminomethyl-2-thiouridine biosynthesis bifunctional protein MnmC n=1 Tax=Pseudobowmanella zhangzhouensis TaxID=1537679 RepID=A0ABW1XLL1_9ALTE|nr:bifunctional tRNA (5-methylaminomethyl-2-thiouridine)(34)-methyltransferase MnmD/FAD-dependent 5-carboxymethylaminomethyl-2-thiouridine(34) oxidoreductase MnmC [Bowmanella sp. JS7-9]TBX22557.1 hypothetical protein TK45_08935 [Bowmanella sp. JS7-9]
MKITPASIAFNQQGTPVATEFDDVYFSNQDGLAESHFVFFQHNGLPQRWQSPSSLPFVIAETGFGTGLNFLQTWQQFVESGQQAQALHFISVEKFPLTRADLAQALASWPTLQGFAAQLIQQYPAAIAGCHRLEFEQGKVFLDLHFGDVDDIFSDMACPPDGLVDAFYLDGFAPSKNPQMWSDSLFSHMARLGKPGSTFATFTAAGFVRRGLQAAGYSVDKVPGFGTKREMLCGRLENKPLTQSDSCWQRYQAKPASKQVTIIGAGLAGANLAHALAKRGIEINLFSQAEGAADGASGNLQGGFYPQLHVAPSHSSLIQALAFTYAKRTYACLLNDGYAFDGEFCGVLQVGFNPEQQARIQSLAERASWPQDLVHWVDVDTCSELAGIAMPYPALFIREGGWLNPPSLIDALLQKASSLSPLTCHYQHRLQHVERLPQGWLLTFDNGVQHQCETLVFATGAESINLPLLNALPLRPVRGQVEHLPSQGQLSKLRSVVCHKGYLTPAWQGRHAMGSTYTKGDMARDVRGAESDYNLSTLQTALADCDWVGEVHGDGQARASVRCTTPDHQPIMGAMPDVAAQQQQFQTLNQRKAEDIALAPSTLPGMYVLTGLGSRGLCTAPLMAEALVCQMYGEPLPLGQTLLNALNPNRFLLRELKKSAAN